MSVHVYRASRASARRAHALGGVALAALLSIGPAARAQSQPQQPDQPSPSPVLPSSPVRVTMRESLLPMGTGLWLPSCEASAKTGGSRA